MAKQLYRVRIDPPADRWVKMWNGDTCTLTDNIEEAGKYKEQTAKLVQNAASPRAVLEEVK